MSDKQIEALELALEALYPISHNSTDDYRGQADKAITALRTVIEQAKKQPCNPAEDGVCEALECCKKSPAAPVQVRKAKDVHGDCDVVLAADLTTPPAAPVREHDHALEQALTRLQKRYSELEAKVAAQRQWVGLSDVDLADCTTEEYETALYWERVLREKNAAAQPAYDQTALELCEVCGWKTLIPGDVCLNCEHEASARRQSGSDK